MDGPSFSARIWDFIYVVVGFWTVWVTGFVLVFEQAVDFFFPQFFKRIEAKYPKDLRRRVLLGICVFGFIVASFEAFDDKSMQLRKLQTQVITTRSREIVRINSGEVFADHDTENKILAVHTVQGKPTTIRLTENPRIGQTITISDEGGIAIYAPITILGNGNKITGLDKYVMQIDHGSVVFTYTGNAWVSE